MWYLTICPLITPPTLPLHILMSYEDTLSPLALRHLATARTITTSLYEKPRLLLPVEHEETYSLSRPASLSGCPGLRPFQDLLFLKVFDFLAVKVYSGRHLSVSLLPLETTLAAILQDWSGKTGKRNFTVREWHLHVYLHLVTAVAEWKQPQATKWEN